MQKVAKFPAMRIDFKKGACNKKIYKTKKDAQTMLNFLRKKCTTRRRPTFVYCCTECKGFHLTHKDKTYFYNK